jgi:replicative DNA helicase
MSENKTGMPANLEAEQSLLGCILIDRELQGDIILKLQEVDFYTESHKYIINAIKNVYNTGKPVDIVTLSDQLEKESNLEKAGGFLYLTELTKITPSAAHYKYYLSIVKRDSIHRQLIRASNSIIELASNATNQEESIASAEKLIYDISNKLDNSKLVNISEAMIYQNVISKFEAIAKDKNAFRGMMTGFNKLDQITNGLQRSDLIVLAARPGVGKTSFAMNIIENIAVNEGKVCAVFSLEMPKAQLAQRLICSHARVDMSKALSSKLDLDKDFKKLWAASEELSKAKIFVDDSSIITPAEILSKSRRLKSKYGLDLVMIDYIQLMKSGGKNTENRQQEISEITRNLKILAKEIDVPVIALSQLRRMQGEPQLTDLRESGAIEQDADIVMFIHRPYMDATEAERQTGKIDKDLARIKIAKHRNGGLGTIDLKFVESSTKFINYPHNLPDEPNFISNKEDNRKTETTMPEYMPHDIPDEPEDTYYNGNDELKEEAALSVDDEVFDE